MREDDDAAWAAEAAAEAEDRRRKEEPPPALEVGEFEAWRSPRVVTSHPTRLDNPLWHWLVRTRWDAFHANNAFHGPSPFEAGPMWCFDRFGMSEIALPDGRTLYIGGEHEDHYDPDFFIYNDATLVGPDGEIAIHGYPRDVFPPTDFHSATRVGDEVYVVGRLGYPSERVLGATPVFRLSLADMAIHRVETTGESPGWIHRHAARLSDDGGSLVVTGGEVWRGDALSLQENIDTWSLDIASGQWSRTTALDWQRWTLLRKDRKPNRLWDTRQELWRQEHAHHGFESYWRHDEKPDLEALRCLYRLDDDSPAPEEGEDYNTYRIVVDGVAVRFTEERRCVHAIVEGRLSAQRLDALQRHVLTTLERLDAGAWEVEQA